MADDPELQQVLQSVAMQDAWDEFEEYASNASNFHIELLAVHQITSGDVEYWSQRWDHFQETERTINKVVLCLREERLSPVFLDDEAHTKFMAFLTKLAGANPNFGLCLDGECGVSFQDIQLLEGLKNVPIKNIRLDQLELSGALVGQAFRSLFAAWKNQIKILCFCPSNTDVAFKEEFALGLKHLSKLQQVQLDFDLDLNGVVGTLIKSGANKTLTKFHVNQPITETTLPAVGLIATRFNNLKSFQFGTNRMNNVVLLDGCSFSAIQSMLKQNTTITELCCGSRKRQYPFWVQNPPPLDPQEHYMKMWMSDFERRNQKLHSYNLRHPNFPQDMKLWPAIIQGLEVTNHRDNASEMTAVFEFVKLKAPGLGLVGLRRCRPESSDETE